jgi:uncharacterized protein YciI
MLRRIVFLGSTLAWLAASPAPSQGSPAAAPTESVRYQLGLLVRGPDWTPERTPRTDSIQAGHLANIGRMAAHGALLAAGPFERGGELRGIFVFRPGDDPLDSLMAGDPAIASRRLEVRRYPWIAPPGIGEEYRRNAEARRRLGEAPKDSMVNFGWVMLERGPRYDAQPTAQVKRLLGRHQAHVDQLRASGQLVFAGAIEGEGDLRGVLVLQGDSASVANAIAADPAVRAGRFQPRILRWWTALGTIPGH